MSQSNFVRSRQAHNAEDFRRLLEMNLYHVRGQAIQSASHLDAYDALSVTVRDQLIDRMHRAVEAYFEANPKTVHYLSAEYLLGKQLEQNLLYTDTEGMAREALAHYGLELDHYLDLDVEPGLGNGGLGRLAACFLDSLATLGIPCVGYGIRYGFGIFKQSWESGWQVEKPDEWLLYGNPWEFPQPDDMQRVGFGGRTEHTTGKDGKPAVVWHPDETVLGEPCHMLVPGYGVANVNILRLWRARASEEFDFECFDAGDYTRAVEKKIHSENISKVLYPNDNTPQGQELRLRQQYFFVTCSLRDILQRYRLMNNGWDALPDKAVIQLNDTHPVVAIPELMRILVDEENLDWERAWDICNRTFASTQHTLLPEALEEWPTELFGRLLPRHLEIAQEINRRFLAEVRANHPDDPDLARRVSLFHEDGEQRLRMAHLACVGSFSVNGVAELQSRLLREQVLVDFARIYPDRFNNKTNGVTPRRFMRLANPRLSELITGKIGDGWLRDLDELKRLEPLADDAEFRRQWREVKQLNKHRLGAHVAEKYGLALDPTSLFDVMVKRLHEYKRQLLKALHIITLYDRIKADPAAEVLPRTFIFGAKAAPGYHMAKLIIRLINGIGEVVNADKDVAGRLKVVFLENFNVSLGEMIYPAAELSEQISLAGKEASGTGNMKFALNGALTCGTLDGANVEIRERVGEENFFLFGLNTEEVQARIAAGYDPRAVLADDPELQAVLARISSGEFASGNAELLQPIVDSLLEKDEYLLLADYRAYIASQEQVEAAYRDTEAWTKSAILNTARCGFFSSDRSMREYAKDIWGVETLVVPERGEKAEG